MDILLKRHFLLKGVCLLNLCQTLVEKQTIEDVYSKVLKLLSPVLIETTVHNIMCGINGCNE